MTISSDDADRDAPTENMKQKQPGSVSRRDLLRTSAKVGLGIAAGGALLSKTSGMADAARKDALIVIPLLGGTWHLGFATLSFADQSTPPPVGNVVSVGGVTPTAYNGLWVITESTSNSLSFKLAKDPGADASGGSFALEDLLPASTTIKNLGLSAADAKLLTAKASKLTKAQLFTLASGTPGMNKLKLSVKDVNSISSAFAHANSRIGGFPKPACCCWLCCSSCTIVVSAARPAVRPAVGCCCSCCCCIRINSPGNNGTAPHSVSPEVQSLIQARSRMIP